MATRPLRQPLRQIPRKLNIDWPALVHNEPIEPLIDQLDPMLALLEKHFARIEALSREIRSPGTRDERRIEAVKERDSLISSRKKLTEEVAPLRAKLRDSLERSAPRIYGKPQLAPGSD